MSDERVKKELERILNEVMGDPEYWKKLVKDWADAQRYEGIFIKLRFPNDPDPEKEIGEKCPNCNDVGWYPVLVNSSNPWEAEQVQCEWCYTNPNSRFNLNGSGSNSM